MTDCPCGSGSAFAECCAPLLSGERRARTAEELMRSRYTAYTRKEVDYIVATTRPEQRRKVDRESIATWAGGAEWKGLEIRTTEAGGPDDAEGLVEFVARYTEQGQEREYHERARFSRLEGVWYFDQRRSAAPRLEKVPGSAVGRNEPCPCGSGKKYKKCCGKA